MRNQSLANSIFTFFLFFLLQQPSIAAQEGNKPFVAVTYTEFNFEEGDFLGVVNNHKRIKHLKGKHSRSLGFKNVLHIYIMEGLEEAGYEVTDESRQRGNITGLTKPKVVVKAEIDSVYFNFSGKEYLDFAGYVKVFGKWKIFASHDLKKELKTLDFQVSEDRFKGTKEYILSPPIRLAAKQLGNSEEFKALVSKTEENFLAENSGKKIYLKQVDYGENNSLKDHIQRAIKAVYTLEGKEGIGSAVLISENGYLITNYHVIHNEDLIYAVNDKGEKFEASVVKENSHFDLALLKIEADSLQALKISTQTNFEIGESVFAIGTPLFSDLSQTVSSGIVSGIRDLPYMQVIQTDVSISPGNSGGALMDKKGELIGITTFKIAGQSADGIGFCIPSYEFIKALNLEFYK